MVDLTGFEWSPAWQMFWQTDTIAMAFTYHLQQVGGFTLATMSFNVLLNISHNNVGSLKMP